MRQEMKSGIASVEEFDGGGLGPSGGALYTPQSAPWCGENDGASESHATALSSASQHPLLVRAAALQRCRTSSSSSAADTTIAPTPNSVTDDTPVPDTPHDLASSGLARHLPPFIPPRADHTMQGELVVRRTQFSSCDECRRSRVACDAAARAKTQDGEDIDPLSVSCSRCLNRDRQCTFKWVRENKAVAATKTSQRRKTRTRRPSSVTSDNTAPHQNGVRSHHPAAQGPQPYRSPDSDWQSPFGPSVVDHVRGRSSFSGDRGSDNSLSPPTMGLSPRESDILSPAESQWLYTIYRMGFDSVFGSWMGRFCCPFVAGENSTAEKYVMVPELCKKLDMCMADETMSRQRNFPVDGKTFVKTDICRQKDESLLNAISAFSARWLPLVVKGIDREGGESNVIQALWRRTRRDMLRVINRTSYRSMLALFLFALTPIPAGISEEEEADGISGQACVHAALQQVQILRARQRNLQFNGSKVSLCLDKKTISSSPNSADTSNFINAESTAYWAALTFDTSASLTLNCRSLLSSGLFGFEHELSWRLVRTCAQMFNEAAQSWQTGATDMTDDRANQIVGAGAAWKLLGWKLTAIFKEALRDGHEESKVRNAYAAVVDSIRYFNDTFRPRLEACQARMQFLSQQTKLRWYSLVLHYHLSILMLIDIIEATERYDLMVDLEEVKVEAENTVMNTLVFGLHNTYTLSISPVTATDGNGDATSSITVPLTSIDPYPHHILAGVQLVRKAIERDFSDGKITEDSYSNLQSTLERTLSLLPQSSKSVQAARTKLSEKVPDAASESHQDPYRILHANFAD